MAHPLAGIYPAGMFDKERPLLCDRPDTELDDARRTYEECKGETDYAFYRWNDVYHRLERLKGKG